MPQEDHLRPVVPDAIDELERLAGAAGIAAELRDTLVGRHEIAEHLASRRERLRERALLEVAADVHRESEAVAGIDEMRREARLLLLSPHQGVLVAQAPAAVVGLHAV